MITPQSLDSKKVRETMRIVPYEEALSGVSRVIERPLEKKGALNQWACHSRSIFGNTGIVGQTA